MDGEFGVPAGLALVAEAEVDAGKSEMDARVYWSVLQGFEGFSAASTVTPANFGV